MRPVLPPTLVSRVNIGAPTRPGEVLLQESPRLHSTRFVSGYVGNRYVSVTVEPSNFLHFQHRISGVVGNDPVTVEVGSFNGYLDVSTGTPNLDHATAEALWRLVAQELGLTLKHAR